MNQIINQHFLDSAQNILQSVDILSTPIEKAAECLINCLLDDHKILTCANGYSIGEINRFNATLLNKLMYERPSLPVISLCSDASTITAISNDSSFSEIFSKQISALGQENDVLMALSTNGNCSNIIQAVKVAHDKELKLILITGKTTGNISTLLYPEDIEINVPAVSVERIQEVHNLIINCLCDLIDKNLFGF